MFYGEFEHSLDTKGRLMVPSKLRDAIDVSRDGEGFMMTHGFDGCLFLFTRRQFDGMQQDLFQQSSMMRRDARSLQRLFFSKVSHVPWDGQGRILISERYRGHASLQKEVVLVGVVNRIEIWDRTTWGSLSDALAPDMEELAEKLFGGDAPKDG